MSSLDRTLSRLGSVDASDVLGAFAVLAEADVEDFSAEIWTELDRIFVPWINARSTWDPLQRDRNLMLWCLYARHESAEVWRYSQATVFPLSYSFWHCTAEWAIDVNDTDMIEFTLPRCIEACRKQYESATEADLSQQAQLLYDLLCYQEHANVDDMITRLTEMVDRSCAQMIDQAILAYGNLIRHAKLVHAKPDKWGIIFAFPYYQATPDPRRVLVAKGVHWELFFDSSSGIVTVEMDNGDIKTLFPNSVVRQGLDLWVSTLVGSGRVPILLQTEKRMRAIGEAAASALELTQEWTSFLATFNE